MNDDTREQCQADSQIPESDCDYCDNGLVMYGDLESAMITLTDLHLADKIKDRKHLLEIVQEDMQFEEAECPFCKGRRSL